MSPPGGASEAGYTLWNLETAARELSSARKDKASYASRSAVPLVLARERLQDHGEALRAVGGLTLAAAKALGAMAGEHDCNHELLIERLKDSELYDDSDNDEEASESEDGAEEHGDAGLRLRPDIISHGPHGDLFTLTKQDDDSSAARSEALARQEKRLEQWASALGTTRANLFEEKQ